MRPINQQPHQKLPALQISFRKKAHRRFNLVASALIITSMLVGPLQYSFPPSAAGALAQGASLESPLPPHAESKTAAPWVDPRLPSLALDVAVSPGVVAVGDILTVTVILNNQSPNAATDVAIALDTPPGTGEYLTRGSEGGQDGRWQVKRLDGNGKVSMSSTLRLLQMPSGKALVMRAQATAQELNQPVTEVGGALVVSSGADTPAYSYSYNPTDAAVLSNPTSDFAASIPDNANSNPVTFRYGYYQNGSKDTAQWFVPEAVGFKRGLPPFYISATDADGRDVRQLSKAITLKVKYTPEQLQALGLNEEDLALFRLDEGQAGGGKWVALDTQIDSATRTLTAQTDHLGVFAPGDEFRPSDNLIPSLKSWQVDMAHGSIASEYGIEVPEGPGGVKPDVTLTYNSAATDGTGGMREKQQSSWVGKGFSLNTGYIVTNKLQPGDPTDPGHYSLVLDDREYSIMRSEPLTTTPGVLDPADYAWRTTDESFIRIRVSRNGFSTQDRGGFKLGQPVPRYKWTAWTKDGTRYEFEEDAFWGWEDCGAPTPYASIEAYKWQLSKVVDTHGNTITYNYGRKTQRIQPGETCHGVYGVIDWSVWPTSVTWGANPANGGTPDRYKVQFTSIDRPIDLEADRPAGQLGPEVKETQQLEEILVSSNKSSPYNPNTWELVRRYDLVFESGSDWQRYLLSDASDPNCVPGSNNCQPVTTTRKLTLREIRLFGNDNTTNLPPQTFTYGHVRGTGFYPNGEWNRLIQVNNNQGGVETFQYQTIGATFENQPAYAKHYRNNRRLTNRTVQDGQGHSYTWSYRYEEPALNSLGRQLTNNESGPNQYPNSATVYYSEYEDPSNLEHNRALLVHRANSVFYGHAYVLETDPNGDQTEHWFRQELPGCAYPGYPGQPITGDLAIRNNTCFQELRDREFLKGKEYRTVRHQGAVGTNTKLSEVQHDFTVRFFEYGDSLDERLTGLWRAFSFESVQRDLAWERGTTPLTKTTTFDYENIDPPYGNLILLREQDGTNAVLRETTYSYKVISDTVNYIVDRRATEDIKDGQGRWLARTVYGYDGSLGGNEPLTKGDLTLVRKYYDLPLQTQLPSAIHSADTSSSYDVYGNKTATTTYEGYGETTINGGQTQWGPAGGGGAARTQTTEYDSIFHVFPVRITEPISTLVEQRDYDFRMGTLTRVTDYNGVPTDMTYDVFGRNKTQVKAGDSSTFPTAFIEYHDWEYSLYGRPVKYILGHREVAATNAYRPSMTFYDGLGREIQTKQESRNCRESIVVDKAYDGLGQLTQESQLRYVDIGSENCSTLSPFWNYVPTGGQLYRPTTTTRDALGRSVRVEAPDPSIVTTMEYGLAQDSGGSLRRSVSNIDPNRHRTDRLSDVFGRLVQVVEYSGNNGNEGAYQPYARTTYAYNPLDLLTGVTDGMNKVADSVQYDSLGRKTSMTDLTMGQWSYDYYPNGHIKTQRDNNGVRIVFGLDAMDRLRTKSYPDGGGDTATFNYDEAVPFGKGRLTSTSRAGVIERMEFDARGRKVKAEHTVPEMPGTRVFRWGYDSADRTTTTTYPGTTIAPRQVVTEQIRYEYDAAWRPTKVCSNESQYASICYANNATYTALDQPVARDLGNGLVQSYQYTSPMQRLDRIRVGTAANPGSIFNRAYAYDPASNITSITKYKPDNTVQETENFTYDHRDRLTRWYIPNGQHYVDERYYYDVVGNMDLKEKWRSQTDNETYDYIYDYAHATGEGGAYAVRNVQVKRGSSVQDNLYSYTSNGNTLSSEGPEVRRSYTWNADNQPTRIDKQGGGRGVTEDYLYSADGERVKLKRVNRKTFYLEGLWEEERQDGANGAVTIRLMYMLNGQVVAQREIHPNGVAVSAVEGEGLSLDNTVNTANNVNSFGQMDWISARLLGTAPNSLTAPAAAPPNPNRDVVYLHSDHLGSISVVTDYMGAQGQPQRQEFDPWGLVRNPPGPPINSTSLNYTGQRLDESGLLYYNARYYDPFLSRFVSPDSIVPGMQDGKGGAAASLGAIQNNRLTIDFHEPGFLSSLQREHASTLEKGFRFQSDDGKEENDPWGPVNPQALNRYSYVLNNPVRYNDPSGHIIPILAVAGLAAVGIGSSVAVDVGVDFLLDNEHFDLGTSVRNSLKNPLTYLGAVAGLGALGKAAKILPYVKAIQETKGLRGAKQAHHILEARHLRNWKYTAKQIAEAPAIVLSKAKHQAITKDLMQALSYGKKYTKEEVWTAYKDVYRKYPEWLKAIRGYFR